MAKNLLRDDGLIFVSIDDHEAHNLRQIMNEIFGEEHFIANIAWEKRYTRSNNAKLFYSLKDTILVYRRSSVVETLREERNEKSDSIYSNPDNDPRGPWTSSSYVNPATKEERPNLVYPITNPFTGEVVEHETHAWKYERAEHERHAQENRLWWGKNGDAKYPRLKNFLSESDGGLVPIDLWKYEDSGTTDEGGAELKALFGTSVFDNPKPTKLVKRMLKLATRPNEGDIVLDFFAGSGTTGQAVLDLNQEDGGNRRFILVQLPEKTGEEDFQKVSDITKARIKRWIDKSKEDNRLFESSGFKFFRLASSNFKIWNADAKAQGADALVQRLRLFIENILPERTQQDLLFEIVLKSGLPLTAPIDQLEVRGHAVFSVGEGILFICLADSITEDTLHGMVSLRPRNIICLDAAFHGNDNLKTNTKLLMESHGIEFHTV